ncbi:MAG: 16S rRNA (guanine(527)-N(7))-methyltransferase RsmG [Sulfitobacter sp.]
MISAECLDDVSRETMEDLRTFEALVLKWTKKINLISARDASQVWERHILDSIQVYNCAPPTGDWLDIGSGGGFPGIVAAILAKGVSSNRKFTLVDSDQRKCAFLRTAARELKLNVKVNAERVEQMDPLGTEVLTARALDELTNLLAHAERHLSPTGCAIFPKGANWKNEHKNAQQKWSYKSETTKSSTNADSVIIKIEELARA